MRKIDKIPTPKIDVSKREVPYIGIDPGASGGLAMLHGDHACAIKMPQTEKDIWDWMANVAHLGPVAVIEKVSAMPGQGVTSMFTFGKGYGSLRMALIGNGIPFEEVTPQKWQKALGLGGRAASGSKTAFKNHLKGKAQQYFPKLKVTLATSDALLLAVYCKKLHGGKE